MTVDAETLTARLRDRDATVGIIGLGYVGLPLVRAMARAGFRVIGFDIDQEKLAMLHRGETYPPRAGERVCGLPARRPLVAHRRLLQGARC